jgi:hypothetical protein
VVIEMISCEGIPFDVPSLMCVCDGVIILVHQEELPVSSDEEFLVDCVLWHVERKRTTIRSQKPPKSTENA